jgi:hypothetical protein
MAAGSLSTVLHHLRHLAGTPGAAEPTDAQLLERFRQSRDEAAFAQFAVLFFWEGRRPARPRLLRGGCFRPCSSPD